MQDSHSPGAIRSTLQYVLSSDMPSQFKAVIIGLLTQALRDEDDLRVQGLAPKTPEAWQDVETHQLQTFLDGKIANSWQHADETLMRIASELHRTPLDVRKKATEIGLAAGVDYSVARNHPRPEAMISTTNRSTR